MKLIGPNIRRYERDIVEQIQALVRIRSVAGEGRPGQPYGEEIDRALHYMLRLGAEMGFRTANVDGYAGHVEYGSGEELAAVLVHLDTVPEGTGWSYPPLGGDIHDGRIYGRGASDNKGPAVVALFALKAIRDLGLEPQRRLRIIFGTNEENGMTDLDRYFAREEVPDYAFTPDAGYPIINAEKGYYVIRLSAERAIGSGIGPSLLRMDGGTAPNVVPERCTALLQLGDGALERLTVVANEHPRIQVSGPDRSSRLVLTAAGRSGHGSYPPSGVNAIAHMAEFLHAVVADVPEDRFVSFLRNAIGFEAFGESLGISYSDPVHGRLTVNLAQIRLDEESAEAILNVRIPVTEDGERIIERLRHTAAEAGIALEVTDHLLPLYVAPDQPLIRKLSRAYEAVTGERAELLSIGGGTYARKLRGRGVAFGAGFRGTDTRAHQPDEFVGIEDMMRHGEICLQALYELSRTDEE
ncbi:dipeptidase PepV [Paenibacillus sp. HJGM_3]|uniref:dipeptidase PepV n=1 Tax=Paenibacillus sp. HJGM_3 TaxID=3379816 RepID=UPI003858C477